MDDYYVTTEYGTVLTYEDIARNYVDMGGDAHDEDSLALYVTDLVTRFETLTPWEDFHDESVAVLGRVGLGHLMPDHPLDRAGWNVLYTVLDEVQSRATHLEWDVYELVRCDLPYLDYYELPED